MTDSPGPALTLSATAHRRAVLGLQGLWPGRRFAGASGVGDALRAMHALQLDPLNVAAPKWAPAMMRNVLVKRLTIRGFIVSDFAARHADFLRDMSQWVREGKVKHKEFVTEGLDSAPGAFMGLLKGANFGKQLVRVGPDKA